MATAPSGLTTSAGRDVVVPAALALIAVATLLRGWTAARGYFYADDFLLLGSAREHTLLDPNYYSGPDGTPHSPGALVGAWVAAHLLPLQWAPTVVIGLLLQVATLAAFLTLILRLFGRHPLILPSVAIASLSSLSLPGTVWWSTALAFLPAVLGGTLALVALVDHLRTGGRRSAVVSGVWLATALLFSERALVFVLLALGILLCWFTTGPIPARLRHLVTQHRWPTLTYAVVLGGYAVLVLRWARPLGPPDVPAADLVAFATDAIFRSILPGLVGGPFGWLPVGTAGALADPSPFVMTVCAALASAVITLTIWTRERTGRAWALLGVCAALGMSWPVLHGALALGPVVARDLRYFGELPVLTGVLLAFATIPLAGRWAAPQVDAPHERSTAAATLDRAVVAPLRAAGALGETSLQWVVPALALGLLVPSMLWSHVRYDPWWTHNPAKAWAQQAIPAVQNLPAGTLLGSTYVPEAVVSGLLYPANETTRILAPVLSSEQIFAPGSTTGRLVALDDSGTLRLAGVFGARGTGAPDDGCGWRLGDAETTITLSQAPGGAAPVLRLGTVSGSSLRLPLTAGDQNSVLTIEPGLGAVFVQVPPGVDSVTFHPSPTGATMCTNDITVGTVVPIAGTTP
ncbi:MAG: hypothetical protein KBB39_14635 [Phycicoccus sp.]|nr:hypothetical protein [Phycicoccus sp.]